MQTKTNIKAEIVADSINQQGDRLTSLLITFPRIILAEVNTHRMLSKNTSSSRAIPFKKMVESVENDLFIPIAWQKEHKGMQGSEYLDTLNSHIAKEHWMKARDNAILEATLMNRYQVTKQLCNRLLEPFMWTTMLITGNEESWNNFFELRCPQYNYLFEFYKSKKDVLKESKDGLYNDGRKLSDFTELDWLKINAGQAEIHLMDLSEKIYDAMNESTPKQLEAGEWHIPFEGKIDWERLGEVSMSYYLEHRDEVVNPAMWAIKVSTAMAARTSYTVVGDEKEIDYNQLIKIHDKCKELKHSSVFEHCARAMSDEEYESFIKGELTFIDEIEDYQIEEPLHRYKGWCRNFKGFIPYSTYFKN